VSRWDFVPLPHGQFGPLKRLGKFKIVGCKYAQLLGGCVVSRLRGHFQATFSSVPIFYHRRHELLRVNHEKIAEAILRSLLAGKPDNGTRV
jgi:hypothetical protein